MPRAGTVALAGLWLGLLPALPAQASDAQTRACLEGVQRTHGTTMAGNFDVASVQRQAAAIQRCHQGRAQRTAASGQPVQRASVTAVAQRMAERGGNCAVLASKLYSYRDYGRGHPWVEKTIAAGVRYRCL